MTTTGWRPSPSASLTGRRLKRMWEWAVSEWLNSAENRRIMGSLRREIEMGHWGSDGTYHGPLED